MGRRRDSAQKNPHADVYRMCSPRPKKELVRVVRTPDGTIELDLTGKKSGRGAYLCPDPQCLKKARKARRIERALECAIPEEVYNRMEQEMSQYEQ